MRAAHFDQSTWTRAGQTYYAAGFRWRTVGVFQKRFGWSFRGQQHLLQRWKNVWASLQYGHGGLLDWLDEYVTGAEREATVKA